MLVNVYFICFLILISLICLDLNECETGQQECSEFAQCVNTIGSHSCLCLSGFKGDGKNCSGTFPFSPSVRNFSSTTR